jgi:hypothetical protein
VVADEREKKGNRALTCGGALRVWQEVLLRRVYKDILKRFAESVGFFWVFPF